MGPEIAQYGVKTPVRERKRLPVLDRDQNVGCFTETFAGLLGHGGREVGGRDVAGPADDGKGGLGGEPCAGGNVKDTHTWGNAGCARKGMKCAVTCAKARSYSAAASRP